MSSILTLMICYCMNRHNMSAVRACAYRLHDSTEYKELFAGIITSTDTAIHVACQRLLIGLKQEGII